MYVQGASCSIKATRYGHESNGFHVFGASKRRRISRNGLMRRLFYHEAPRGQARRAQTDRLGFCKA